MQARLAVATSISSFARMEREDLAIGHHLSAYCSRLVVQGVTPVNVIRILNRIPDDDPRHGVALVYVSRRTWIFEYLMQFTAAISHDLSRPSPPRALRERRRSRRSMAEISHDKLRPPMLPAAGS
jgi:hypothetical protein